MHEDKAKEVCHICAKEFRDLKHHILYTHQGGWATLMDKPCPEPGCKRMFRLASNYEHLFHSNISLVITDQRPPDRNMLMLSILTRSLSALIARYVPLLLLLLLLMLLMLSTPVIT